MAESDDRNPLSHGANQQLQPTHSYAEWATGCNVLFCHCPCAGAGAGRARAARKGNRHRSGSTDGHRQRQALDLRIPYDPPTRAWPSSTFGYGLHDAITRLAVSVGRVSPRWCCYLPRDDPTGLRSTSRKARNP